MLACGGCVSTQPVRGPADLRIDFQAYGLNRLLVEWLLKNNDHDTQAIRKADAAYVEAVAAWRRADASAVGEQLKAAFSILADLRKQASPLEVFFLECPHLGILFENQGFFELEWPEDSRETLLSYLENVNRRHYKANLEAGASCWKNLARRFPALVAEVGQAWRERKLATDSTGRFRCRTHCSRRWRCNTGSSRWAARPSRRSLE